MFLPANSSENAKGETNCPCNSRDCGRCLISLDQFRNGRFCGSNCRSVDTLQLSTMWQSFPCAVRSSRGAACGPKLRSRRASLEVPGRAGRTFLGLVRSFLVFFWKKSERFVIFEVFRYII